MKITIKLKNPPFWEFNIAIVEDRPFPWIFERERCFVRHEHKGVIKWQRTGTFKFLHPESALYMAIEKEYKRARNEGYMGS